MSNTIASLYHRYVGKRALMLVLDTPEIERRGTITPANLGVRVPVSITDARIIYGKAQCLIRPLRGVGSAWVSSARMRIVDDWPDDSDTLTPEPEKEIEDAPAETETPVLDEQG